MTIEHYIVIIRLHERHVIANDLLVILWETKERMVHYAGPPNNIRIFTRHFHFSLDLNHHVVTLINEIFAFVIAEILFGFDLIHVHVFAITLEKILAYSFAEEMAGVNMH